MYDVVAVGESLIDFTPTGVNQAGIQLFGCNPGGAPANVLAMCARLGGSTAFIGKVGKDDFGDFLRHTMENAHIHTQGLLQSSQYPTTLAFVQLTPQGDRSFSFYRSHSADIMLQPDEVDGALVRYCRILHFGSMSMTAEPARSATLAAAKAAREAGALISYDPNYRSPLWSTKSEAVEQMCSALPLADLVKVSEEELELLTNTSDLATGAQILSNGGATLVVVTLGSGGAFYYTDKACGRIPTYGVCTVDTTGAGDAFWGSLLYQLRNFKKSDILALEQCQLEKIIAFANAAGSLTTTAHGAIPAMPSTEQIVHCMESVPLLCQ